MKKRRFKNTRLITAGVRERIPAILQMLLWEMTDDVEEQDYLQVFEITASENGVSVCHKQEVPPYEKRVDVYGTMIANPCEKVYIIDDETHSTMLLAEEY